VKVTVIDHGAANVSSVERALMRIGVTSERAATPDSIATAQALILPGVGHFSALVRTLDEQSLRQPLSDAITRGAPFLGICLGLQALYDASEEAPSLRGLGVLPGQVTSLPNNVKLPHMGWNRLRTLNGSRLLRGVPADSYFYFAHSFAAPVSEHTAAACAYGPEFAAAIERGNLFAVQFHPEKSGAAGEQILCNFAALAAA